MGLGGGISEGDPMNIYEIHLDAFIDFVAAMSMADAILKWRSHNERNVDRLDWDGNEEPEQVILRTRGEGVLIP